MCSNRVYIIGGKENQDAMILNNTKTILHHTASHLPDMQDSTSLHYTASSLHHTASSLRYTDKEPPQWSTVFSLKTFILPKINHFLNIFSTWLQRTLA